jgi:hypothetical protein
MTERTQEQVVTEIHKQREELVSAVAEVRRDMTREIEHLRELAKKQLPKVAAGAGLLIATMTVRRVRRARRTSPEGIERLRVGRYSLVEHL